MEHVICKQLLKCIDSFEKIQKLQEGEALRKTRTQSREECHGIIRELQLARVYRLSSYSLTTCLTSVIILIETHIDKA